MNIRISPVTMVSSVCPPSYCRNIPSLEEQFILPLMYEARVQNAFIPPVRASIALQRKEFPTNPPLTLNPQSSEANRACSDRLLCNEWLAIIMRIRGSLVALG
jgi:hypothetical protein